MGLETGTYIDSLVVTNPTATDPRSEGDDHLRLVKATIKATFPNLTGAVTPTQAELNFVDGVTSAIQTQLDAKQAADADLTTWAGITPGANVGTALAVAVGSAGAVVTNGGAGGTPSSLTLTNATGLPQAGTVGLTTADSPEFAGVNIGHASDTTLTRVSAGVIAVEGNTLASVAASQAEMETGTEAALRTMSPLRVSQAIAALGGGGGIDTTHASITTSTTLTAASATYLPIAMSALGQSITLPDATTLTVGAPKYYFDNASGGYPVGIRNSAGTLLMAIAAGGTAYVSCENISTAAGVWNVTGNNLEPGLITIDNTFSSTYASTVLKPFVALDDNKSIHFLALSSGFAAVAVDNTTGAVGTPVTVDADSGSLPYTVFKVTSTTAICFYLDAGFGYKAVILSLSGATTLAVGTPDGVASYNIWGAEDFSGAPKIAQLSSTLYLTSYTLTTNTHVRAVSVSGTAVTIGAQADIITASSVANSTTTYALTATTGLVFYASDAAPYAMNAVVVSVSGTTCTVGTPAQIASAISWIDGTGSTAATCLLSSTLALMAVNANNTIAGIYAVTVSGTSVSFGALLTVESAALGGDSLLYRSASATRYNPHLFPLSASTALLWYLDSSGVSRTVVLSESGGTVTAGTILYNSISRASASASGAGVVLPQGTASFFSVTAEIMESGGTAISNTIWPHKISATTITTGNGFDLTGDRLPFTPIYIYGALLLNGKMVLSASSHNTLPVSSLVVFSSNGDYIGKEGVISIPPIGGGGYPMPQVLSSNRICVIGSMVRGTTIGASTYQLRLLNVEIAA